MKGSYIYRKRHKHLKAFSLIELIIGVALAGLLITSGVAIAVQAYISGQVATQKIKANGYLQEQFNAILENKYYNWSTLNNIGVSQYYQYNSSTNKYDINTGTLSIVDIGTTYSLSFLINAAYRDGTGLLTITPGTFDSHYRNVVVTATWKDIASNTQNVEFESYLNDWDTQTVAQDTFDEFRKGADATSTQITNKNGTVAKILRGTTTTNTSTTLIGVNTTFLKELVPGDTVYLSSNPVATATVNSLASNTSATLSASLGDGTGQSIYKNVKDGEVVITSNGGGIGTETYPLTGGIYYSPLMDTKSTTSKYFSIDYTANLGAGSAGTITISVISGNDPSVLNASSGSWQSITCVTIPPSVAPTPNVQCDLRNISIQNAQFFRYKAVLTTSSTAVTPQLKSVKVYFQ